MRALVLLLLLGVANAEATGSVRGRVLDADGNGLRGVVVTAHRVSSEEPWSRTSKTGDDGGFVLEDLPAGEYVLEMGKPAAPAPKAGTLEEQVAGAFTGALMERLAHSMRRANAKGHPHLVAVLAGESVEHDFRVPRKVAVSLVFEHCGKPLARAPAQLVAIDSRGRAGWTMTTGDNRPPRTDSAGVIAFPEVAEGRYAVFVEIGDWEVQCGLIDVAGKEPMRVPVVLGPYEARVRVLDGRGEPVREAEVHLGQEGPEWVGVGPKDFGEVRSRTGVYEVPFLIEGTYRAWVNVGTGHAGSDPFAVGAGDPPEVVVRMDPMGTIVVRVVDGAGDPVRKVHVRAVRVSDGAGVGHDTSRRGEVRFPDLTVGAWRVGIGGDGLDFRGEPREVEVKGFEETRVELTK
jgi:hypothetical protein